MRIIPMLFNTEMVRAIEREQKTVTRRVIRGAETSWSFQGLDRDPAVIHVRADGAEYPKTVKGLYATFGADLGVEYPIIKAPCEPGDIIWVRETWCVIGTDGTHNEYGYMADGVEYGTRWRPSIHMPKEAARIFLQVKDVRVERLQCITRAEALKEGANPACAVMNFKAIWESTTKPANVDKYGWDANPWVWVIEFERTDKPEGWPGIRGSNERRI